MILRLATPLLLFIFGCQSGFPDDSFKQTRFAEDVRTLKLEQVSSSPEREHFLGVFYDESKSMSGIKVVKLYNSDSVSIDENYYGAHPLEVDHWSDSGIVFNAGVFSAHGDFANRKRYLDGSVDRNEKLENFSVYYQKDYDFRYK